jgi:16S rRNA processing protein RimM
MTEYYKIGKLVSAFGLKGEIIVQHNLGKKTSLKDLQAMFIESSKENFIPYFIESARIKSNEELYVKFEGINNREQATRLVQKEAWLTQIDFSKYAAQSSPLNLLGYDIIDGDKNLGKIIEVIEQPHQLLCRLEIENKEVLIPLHDETIKKMDKKKKQIIVQLPEGLLEIYL